MGNVRGNKGNAPKNRLRKPPYNKTVAELWPAELTDGREIKHEPEMEPPSSDDSAQPLPTKAKRKLVAAPSSMPVAINMEEPKEPPQKKKKKKATQPEKKTYADLKAEQVLLDPDEDFQDMWKRAKIGDVSLFLYCSSVAHF